jgi:hypothetical protein
LLAGWNLSVGSMQEGALEERFERPGQAIGRRLAKSLGHGRDGLPVVKDREELEEVWRGSDSGAARIVLDDQPPILPIRNQEGRAAVPHRASGHPRGSYFLRAAFRVLLFLAAVFFLAPVFFFAALFFLAGAFRFAGALRLAGFLAGTFRRLGAGASSAGIGAN